MGFIHVALHATRKQQSTESAALWRSLEKPLTSRVWKTPPGKEMLRPLYSATLHMCAYGLCDSQPGAFLQKPTLCLCSHSFVAEVLEKKCPGEHRHVPIRGQTITAMGKRASLSSLAAGYSVEFVNAVLKKFENVSQQELDW